MSPQRAATPYMGVEERSYAVVLGRLATGQLQDLDQPSWASYLVHQALSLATLVGLGPLLVPAAMPVVCLDPLEGNCQLDLHDQQG